MKVAPPMASNVVVKNRLNSMKNTTRDLQFEEVAVLWDRIRRVKERELFRSD